MGDALRAHPDALRQVHAAADLFPRAAHAEAVARIGFCISEGLLAVLVGEVGCGKTIAVRAAVDGLDRTHFK